MKLIDLAYARAVRDFADEPAMLAEALTKLVFDRLDIAWHIEHPGRRMFCRSVDARDLKQDEPRCA